MNACHQQITTKLANIVLKILNVLSLLMTHITLKVTLKISKTVVPTPLPPQVSEDAVNCPATEREDIIMDDNDQFQDENVANDEERTDDKNDHEYDHIMVNRKIGAPYDNDGPMVPFNGITQKQINIGCCSLMESMTIQNWMTIMKQK